MAKAKDELKTVDIPDVEILATGTWNGSRGPVTYTDEDLDNIVSSFDEISKDKKLNYEPPVKLGHSDKQKLLQEDGYPAAGWISSLKKVGNKLVASFKAVPATLAEIIKAGGYKKVSSEIYPDYKIGGKTYPSVLKAVALLGADIPAVKTIQDIQALYTEYKDGDMPFNVVVFQEVTLDEVYTGLDEWLVKAEECIRGKAGAPAVRHFVSEVKAKLKGLLNKQQDNEESLDKQVQAIRDAFYQQNKPLSPPPPMPVNDCWVKEVYPDCVIVEGRDGLTRVPYTVDADGNIVFDMTQAVEVEVAYQPVTNPGEPGDVNNQTEILNQEANVKELRELLGLDEKADVLETVKALKSKADAAATNLAEGEQLKTRVTKLEEALADSKKVIALKERDERVGKAISAGKVTPAQKAWAEEYAFKDAAGFDAFVASAPVVVKLGEIGTSSEGPAVELTESERKVAKQLGVTEEMLLKAKQAEKTAK